MAARDMIARHSNYDETADFIPTPPFATRVLFEYVAPRLKEVAKRGATFWDPACGAGHMCGVFEEYGASPIGSDLFDHGYKDRIAQDFAVSSVMDIVRGADVIVTNPPYAKLNEFILEGLDKAAEGFALLVRIQALEGQTRYKNVFSKVPPTTIAVFSDRIPFKTGVVVRKASKMFTHCWLYWDVNKLRNGDVPSDPRFMWIPSNAQELLEKDSDYA